MAKLKKSNEFDDNRETLQIKRRVGRCEQPPSKDQTKALVTSLTPPGTKTYRELLRSNPIEYGHLYNVCT